MNAKNVIPEDSSLLLCCCLKVRNPFAQNLPFFPSAAFSFQEQANKQEELKLGHSCIFQRNYPHSF